ncbi:MAG: hypothetical protein V1920_03455 [Bacillota bacterium]
MKKLSMFFKKRLSKIKTVIIGIGVKRIMIMVFAFILLLIVVLSFFKQSSIDTFYDTSELTYNYQNESLSTAFNTPLYTSIKQDYLTSGLLETDEEKTILTGEMTSGLAIDFNHPDYGSIVSDYIEQTGVNQDVYLLDSNHPISIANTSTESGLYYFGIDYYELEEGINNTQISITINGVNPFYESQTLVLPSKWMMTTTLFTLDRYQNEIQPSSDKIKNWSHHKINDYRGMHPGLFAFELNENDVIEIRYVNGQLLLGQFYYVREDRIPTYSNYLATNGNADVINDEITIAAREMYYRNDPSIRLRP